MSSKSIGMSSRGHENELILLIEDLLHMEQHTAEEIERHPELADELGEELDEIRRTRQAVVKEFSEGRAHADFWCATKHASMAHLRGQEILNNIVRIQPEKAQKVAKLNKKLSTHRDYAIKNFLSGNGEATCDRCIDDLDFVAEKDKKVEWTITKNLNTNDQVTKGIESHTHNSLSTNYRFGGEKMRGKKLRKHMLLYAGAGLAGKLISAYALDYVNQMMPVLGFVRPRSYINTIVGGLAMGSGLYMNSRKSPLMSKGLMIGGAVILADGLVSLGEDVYSKFIAGSTSRTKQYYYKAKPSKSHRMSLGLSPTERMQGTPLTNTTPEQELVVVD